MPSSMRNDCGWCLLLLCGVLAGPQLVHADRFVYVDADQQKVEVEARLVVSGKGAHVLELRDGQYRIIPQGAVVEREPADGPTPWTGDEVAAQLAQRFGEDRFRSYVQEPFVMGLVLSTPLPKAAESRATALLKKGGRFMNGVANAFASFIKETKLDIADPTHPLVVLIFETDVDFEAYANEATGGNSLSARSIDGFYSGITNFLAIRLSECQTFDVPLHEAIHQQVYNRNMFRRLSPIPHWFDEGIATGFETNNGRITVSPVKVSPRYAKQAFGQDDFDWELMGSNDKVFQGDVLAGEAYGQAWGAHWLMVTKYRDEYKAYVRTLAAKEPLADDPEEQRKADIKEAFGMSLSELESEFEQVLSGAIKKQKTTFEPPKRPGISITDSNLAHIELTAVNDGRLRVEGKLLNQSPLRPMTFHVTVETDAGTYAEWLIHDLAMSRATSLPTQYVTKFMENGPGGPSRSFRVRVRSVPPDSREAAAWQNGSLPVPVYQE